MGQSARVRLGGVHAWFLSVSLAALSAAALGVPASAFAYTESADGATASSSTPPPAAGAQPGASTQLQEVIVTAQKRSENLQKTPLVVTAIGAKALEDERVTTPNDLTRVVPGVTVNSGGAAGDTGQSQAVFSIRGLGASGQGPLGAPAVAVHEDGHYLVTGLATNQFYDLERVEVLPGPQGTLYGRSASAGAVNVVTNKPSSIFEAFAELEGGDYGYFRGTGTVNVPVTDTLALRFSGQVQRHDGYFSNGFDDLDSKSVRGQALWKPLPKLSIRLLAQYYENTGVGSSPIYVGPTAAALGITQSDPYDRSIANLGLLNGKIAPLNVSVNNQKTDILAEVAYDFGWSTLTVSPTYEEFNNKNNNVPIGGPYGYLTTSGPAVQRGVEARLNDNGQGRLRWVVGYNYFNRSFQASILENVVPNALATAQVGPFRGIQFVQAFDDIDHSEQTGHAIFAQGTYSLTPRLRFTLGARQNWDDQDYRGRLGTNVLTVGASPNLIRPGAPSPELSSSVDFSKATYRVALDYDLGPASLVYASVGSGYKPGGLNEGGPASSNVPPTPLAPSQTFQPETVTHYEVGSKNRFLGGRLQINDAIYYDKYSNYQNLNNQPVNPLASGAIGAVVTNAGSAEVYGNELSGQFQATRADLFEASLTYLHATFTNFILPAYLGQGGAVVPQANYSGFDLPKAPRWSSTLSYSHRFELENGGSLVGLVSSYLSSSYYAYFQEQAGTRQSSFTKTLLSVTYHAPNHLFDASAYVKNLENSITLISGSYTAPFTYVFLDEPRTFGVSMSKHF